MRISDWSSDVFSSDLGRNIALDRHQRGLQRANRRALRGHRARQVRDRAVERGQRGRRRRADLDPKRSEEHTSELQSLMRISYAVFCLKKKLRFTSKQHNA